MDDTNVDEAQVTLFKGTYDDLMMITGITRGDHRKILAELVEGLRLRLVPKLEAPAQRGGRRGPKAAS